METPESDRSARARPDDDVARYSSLVDYLRVIRRHRLLIVLVILVCSGAAFAYSKTRATTYEAEAQMSFGDPFQDLTLFTSNPVSEETPAVRAANGATLVTSARVERKATGLLNRPPSGCSIDASVLVETNNVAVDG